MKNSIIILIFLIILNFVCSNDIINFRKILFDLLNAENNNNDREDIVVGLRNFLEKFTNISIDNNTFNNCAYKLFNKTNNIFNYLYLFSYSGKEFSDLGLQSDCINNRFSYYLLSFDYNISLKDNNKIYEFLEQNKFYIGLCIMNECDNLIKNLSNGNPNFINNYLYNPTIVKIKDKEDMFFSSEEEYISKPYYSLNENGKCDETLTEKEKIKYRIFIILFIIIIVILGIEILLSIIINCGYNMYNSNSSKELSKELNIENENDNDEERDNYSEGGIDGHNIFTNNPSSQKEKKENFIQKLIKILYKYISILTNIIILTIRKSKYFNNKNMATLTQLRILSLLLITFSTNFDVLIKMTSKAFYDDSFYKEIYFIFLKFASFGLDIYITLDGFEVMYKLMNYYKKNYYDKGNNTITFLGILKFYLYSLYKIFSYIIIFLIVNYFNRYYIYMHIGHNGEALYSYYSNNIINKNNIFQILNPKYTFLSYFFPGDKNNDDLIFNSKMSMLFLNEFYIFTLFIFIFYIGNILKSKIYDYILLAYMFITYLLSYFICLYSNNYNVSGTELYTYNKITRNILLIKYPHILFNHYLMGAFTGLVCFYLKDSTSNNPISNDKDKCPFSYCLHILGMFDFLIQKLKKVFLFLAFLILIMICCTFTLLLYLNTKNNNDKLSLDFILSLKIIYYYESGLFIFIFCFITILFFANENESKKIRKYNILNLINRISFSYINTIYLMAYSYFCLFVFQFKLTYQNIFLYTLGLFVFFCIENLILTITFVLPFKIIFKSLLDKYIIINKSSLHLDEIQYNKNNIINNVGINSYNNDEDDDSDSR